MRPLKYFLPFKNEFSSQFRFSKFRIFKASGVWCFLLSFLVTQARTFQAIQLVVLTNCWAEADEAGEDWGLRATLQKLRKSQLKYNRAPYVNNTFDFWFLLWYKIRKLNDKSSNF